MKKKMETPAARSGAELADALRDKLDGQGRLRDIGNDVGRLARAARRMQRRARDQRKRGY